MYASSIFGWLDLLECRVREVSDQTPVSKSSITVQHTEACNLAISELTEQLESVFGSVIVSERSLDSQPDFINVVLNKLKEEGVVTQNSLRSPVRDAVEKSSNYRSVNQFVLVPVNTVDYNPNVLPVITVVVDWIKEIMDEIFTILKFLEADDTDASDQLNTRWRLLGSLLQDIHHCCLKLLHQIRQHDWVTNAVTNYSGTTDEVPMNVSRYTDD